MKTIITALAILALTGCGSSSKTYETIENNITVDEPYQVPSGTSVIVDGSSNTNVSLQNDTLVIDCGAGGCGSVNIGTEVIN